MAAGEAFTLTPEREQKFREMWEAGVPGAEIGEAFGVTHKTVFRRARALGLPPRRTNLTAERGEDILRLHRSGLHPKAITRELGGGDPKTVAKLLRRNGIEPHRAPLGRPSADAPRRSASDRSEKALAAIEEQVVRAECGRCAWTATGTFAETREGFKAHICSGAVAA